MEWQYELDKAKEEGRLNALISLYKEGLLDLKTVLKKTGLTEKELERALKEE